MSLNDSFGQSVQNIYKSFPDAENDIFSLVKSPDGSYRCYPTSGWKGMFMMSKKAVKTEDDLMKIIEFFDKLQDQEMQELIEYGVEGDHYKVSADGKIELIKRDDYQKVSGDFGQLSVTWANNKREPIYTPIQAKAKQMIAENTPYAIPNVINPYISETQSQLGTTLDQIIYDARDKYIIGAIDLDGFNKEVEKWRSQGGDKIIEEYSAAHKAASGK
jgi:putative aldouronate transport system substrate-binding protein